MSNLNVSYETEADILRDIEASIERGKGDCPYFISTFCYTYDPKRPPFHLPFELFDFQVDLVHEIIRAIREGDDLFIEKCREMGATYTVIAVIMWMWLYEPGFNALLGSRKQDYVDASGSDELSNKEEALFGKLEYMLRRLPVIMLPKGFSFDRHKTFMSLINPENGNVVSGESANPNFSRGSRRTVILLDEFAFWENDTAAWGATADTTNCRIVLTTPGDKPSKAKRLRQGQDGEEIKVITLHYDLDPRKDKEWVEKQRKRRSNEDFSREIMINWEGSLTGIVYGEISQAVVGAFPYVPGWPLYRSWDFGLDAVAIQWWQVNPDTGRLRIVDAYKNEDKPIQWYFPFVGKQIDSTFTYNEVDLEDIAELKDITGAIEYGDPDVAKRSLLTGTSTRQALEAVGIFVQTKPEANDFGSRKEKTKVLLQQGIEVNDNRRTFVWLESMKQARYPQRPEESQATGPVRLPIHNWTSHHRSATEFFAVNYEPPRPIVPFPQEASRLFSDGGFY